MGANVKHGQSAQQKSLARRGDTVIRYHGDTFRRKLSTTTYELTCITGRLLLILNRA